MECQFFYPGDIVEVLDHNDLETKIIATVKYVEPDSEYEYIQWVYLIANEEVLNDKTDPRFPFMYWRVIANNEPYIKLIERVS